MDNWLRFAIFALIIFSFLRRIFKVKAGARSSASRPAPGPQAGQQQIPQVFARQGRKNDFRDVPPPPENPELG